MNSFTTNYNLDLYDVDDKPNLNDQYNDAMGKIDNALHGMSNDIVTAETAVNNLSTKVDTANDKIATNSEAINNLQTSVETAQTTAENGVNAAHEANELAVQASSAAQSAQSTANTALTKANANASSITTLNGKFPITAANVAAGAIGATQIASNAVTSAKIAPAAVTAEKLAAGALASVFQSMHIRRFDSTNAQADNTGMVVPTGGSNLKGFYVEELKLLVINALQYQNGTANFGAYTAGNTGFLLPTYIPRPTTNVPLATAGLLRASDQSGTFEGWSGVGINTSGYIGPSSGIVNTKSAWLYGNLICFLSPFGVSLTTLNLSNVYSGMVAQNEALND